jgi:signal transduction histidine kinase
VSPPYYRRWWFYILALVAIGGVLLLLHLLRLRGIKREFNAVLAERNRIAREIHDTLAQDFVGVSVQLEVVAQMLARVDVPAAAAQINATRKLVREGLEDARQSIWELRAAGARESLPNRLAGVVKRAADRGVKTECRIGGTYRELPRKYEEELLRISQEAIANVLKHAEAGAVSVDLRYSPDRLLLRIVDDGCGFVPGDVSSEEKHFGLKGMQERAAVIGATCNVLSSMGEGTTVTVEVPL